mmetsp:Transcript_106190/g.327756  ORF Transcript_106190/g.327756 Transcript_106190/m.327756 type:complete len:254 (+) Transcript_106190:1140-1901(+)
MAHQYAVSDVLHLAAPTGIVMALDVAAPEGDPPGARTHCPRQGQRGGDEAVDRRTQHREPMWHAALAHKPLHAQGAGQEPVDAKLGGRRADACWAVLLPGEGHRGDRQDVARRQAQALRPPARAWLEQAREQAGQRDDDVDQQTHALLRGHSRSIGAAVQRRHRARQGNLRDGGLCRRRRRAGRCGPRRRGLRRRRGQRGGHAAWRNPRACGTQRHGGRERSSDLHGCSGGCPHADARSGPRCSQLALVRQEV